VTGLMCYTRKDQSFEEEVRRLRAEKEGRRKGVRPAHQEPEKDKPLTEKVKKLVGAR
jgi:hypothetical protein